MSPDVGKTVYRRLVHFSSCVASENCLNTHEGAERVGEMGSA